MKLAVTPATFVIHCSTDSMRHGDANEFPVLTSCVA